jgi:hypothetical protein
MIKSPEGLSENNDVSKKTLMMIQKSVIILSNRQSKKERDFKNKNSIAS